MDGIAARLRQLFWNLHARNWDRVHSSADVARHYGEVALWLAGAVPPGARLLDIGCGTARHAVELAHRGFDVVALDFAPEMLACAAARAAREGVALDLRQLDVRSRLPFDDHSFDGVLCSYVLQAIDDPVRLFRETRRVLKQGAVLLAEVPVRRAGWTDVVSSPTSRPFLLVKLMASRFPGAVQTYGPQRLTAELRRAGFSVDQPRSFPRSYAVLASRR
jgi:ubiquinone/menaquinone biosynthesis C-methylase UbiE